ncbi:hypothetical protein NDU88_006565 [Pleurodeles waltl]|uniref:Uncharacterized protein n=1 Tax=Pleurodeles waltl TaxID=8319 RepID=A0AAV7X4G1_PLEWA|nr:hypothetical protein NDU88_006565 [Pleurodeles waltl]
MGRLSGIPRPARAGIPLTPDRRTRCPILQGRGRPQFERPGLCSKLIGPGCRVWGREWGRLGPETPQSSLLARHERSSGAPIEATTRLLLPFPPPLAETSPLVARSRRQGGLKTNRRLETRDLLLYTETDLGRPP